MSPSVFDHRRSTDHGDASERRFRDLLHEVDGIVWELELATHRFTFVNRRAEALLGYPLEVWLAAQDFWSTLIDARDRERAQAAYAEASRGERVVEHEFRAVAADGRTVWLRDRAHRAASGRLRGLMVDVTEQKRLEQERDDLLLREQTARAEVEAAVEMVRRLEAITEAALGQRSLDQLLRGIAERIHRIVDADTTMILLPTEDGGHLAVAHAIGADADAGTARIPIGQGLTGRIAASGRTAVVDDADGELDLGPLRSARVRSVIGVPLSVDGAVVGVVHAARRRRRAFTTEQARLLQLVGDRLGVAIRNARLVEDTRRARHAIDAARRRTTFLADATTALFAARDAASALTAVARLAVPAIGDWCAMDVRERDGRYRRVAFAHRDAEAERRAAGLLGTLTDAPPADGALGRALHTRAVQWRGGGARADELETRGGADERALLSEMGVGSYVCAPLVARRRTLGAITVVAAGPERAIGQDDLALVAELARRAAVALDERRRRRETRELLRLFARLVSGALEVARHPVDVGDVVDAAGRAVAEEARAKNVAIELRPPGQEVRVRGDRRRLLQVTQRILEGALRVTPTGRHVQVGIAGDGGSALVTVRADGASAAPLTGLRLAIVRRLLELHGGAASLTRADDRTPTVTVRLPLLA
jgi:PAS domain S-box-containing protein